MTFDELKDEIITHGDFHEFGVHHMVVQDRCAFTLWEGLHNNFDMVFQGWAKSNRDHKYIESAEREIDDILIWYNEDTEDTIIGQSISEDYYLKGHAKAIVTDVKPVTYTSLEKIYGDTLALFDDAIGSQFKMYAAPSLNRSGLEISVSKMKEMTELHRYCISGIPNIVFRNITEPTDLTVSFVKSVVQDRIHNLPVFKTDNNAGTRNGLFDVVKKAAEDLNTKSVTLSDILKVINTPNYYMCFVGQDVILDLKKNGSSEALWASLDMGTKHAYAELDENYRVSEYVRINQEGFLVFISRDEVDGNPESMNDIFASKSRTIAVYEYTGIDLGKARFSIRFSDCINGLHYKYPDELSFKIS